ncbi:transposase, partial [Thermus scotoductus]
RKGLVYSRGDRSKGGNLNLRRVVRDGGRWLRIHLREEGCYAWALVRTSHPRLGELLVRA